MTHASIDPNEASKLWGELQNQIKKLKPSSVPFVYKKAPATDEPLSVVTRKQKVKKIRKVKKPKEKGKIDLSIWPYEQYRKHVKHQLHKKLADKLTNPLVRKFIQQTLAAVDQVYSSEQQSQPAAVQAQTELLHRTLETYEHLEDRHKQELEIWNKYKQEAETMRAEAEKIDPSTLHTELDQPAEQDEQDTFDPDVGVLLHKLDSINQFVGQMEIMLAASSRVAATAHETLREVQALDHDPRDIIRNFDI